MSTDFIAQNAKAKLGKEPKDLRVAIIHEDGAYGVDVAKGNEAGAKKAGFNIVLKEGYSAPRPTCRRWSPSSSAPGRTSSSTPATTPTSRCCCARRASRG